MKILLLSIFVLSFSLTASETKRDQVKGSSAAGHDHQEDEEGHKDHDHKKENNDHKGHDHGKDDDHKGHDHGKNKEAAHDSHSHGDDGHDDHGGGKAVGKGKAIEMVDEKNGFKLSKEAIKTLNLKLKTVNGDEFSIKKTSLVTSKGAKGIYRFRGGFFKFLPIQLKKEENGGYLVKVKGVEFGDQIVTNGLGLLRITDVYSTDSSEYGHSH